MLVHGYSTEYVIDHLQLTVQSGDVRPVAKINPSVPEVVNDMSAIVGNDTPEAESKRGPVSPNYN